MVMRVTHYPTSRKLQLAERAPDGLRGGVAGESWVFCLGPGRIGVEQGDGTVRMEDITEMHLRSVAAETRRALTAMARRTPAGATPWTFPVLREHVKIARREGDIQDVRYTTAQGLTGLWALVKWTPGAWRDVQGLKAQHVSVGITPRWPDETGTIYGPILWEISLTTHPRAKAIGRIQDTLSLRMSEHTGAKTMDEQMMAVLAELIGEQLGQVQTALMAEIASLREEIAKMTPAADAAEAVAEEAAAEEAVEAAEDAPAEEVELAERVTQRVISAIETQLRTRGLNLNERSGGASPATRQPARGPLTLDQVKRETGLDGKAACAEYLRRTNTK